MKRLTCAGAALLSAAALGQTAATRVTAVRFWSLGEVTRIAIETDGELRYRSERVEKPDRLVFDLPGVRHSQRALETIAVGDRLVRRIRIAQRRPDMARVVLDLAAPVKFSVSQLTNPDRLIIELRLGGHIWATPPARSVTGSHSIPEPPPIEEPAPATGQVMVEVSKSDLPPPPLPTRYSEPPPSPIASPKLESTPHPIPAAKLEPPATAARPEKPAPKNHPEVALAARTDSNGDRSLIRVLGLKLERVVIDPGHGGHDTGTIGPSGLEEKTLVLDVAKRLGTLVSARLGSEVIYTRSDDTFVPLETRTQIANEKKADLFLSIHANSSRTPSIAGTETYYLNFTTSESALEVAARENATSQTSIYDLQTLVQEIALKEKVQESREFAGAIQRALYLGVPHGKPVKNRGVKKAPFVVLVGAQMPSVLAEIAFLSNPREEKLLKRPAYRQRIAEALFKGVSQYVNTLSHFQVAQQKSPARAAAPAPAR